MKIILSCLPLIVLVIGKIIIKWYDRKIDKGIDELARQSKRCEVTEQAIKDSFEKPNEGTHYESFDDFVADMERL